MTVERNNVPEKPIFPLPTEFMWTTLDWMHENLDPKNPPKDNMSLLHYWEELPSVYFFQRDMANFRKAVFKWNKPQNLGSYEKGFILGYRTCSDAFTKLGHDPIPDPDTFNTFFENLIADQDSSVLTNRLRTLVYGDPTKPLTPGEVVSALARGKISETLLSQVQQNILSRGEERTIARKSNSYFDLLLRRKDFIESYGPLVGLQAGATDALMVMRDHGESLKRGPKTILSSVWDLEALDLIGTPLQPGKDAGI